MACKVYETFGQEYPKPSPRYDMLFNALETVSQSIDIASQTADIVLPIGTSGSGKSTWIKSIIKIMNLQLYLPTK